MSKERRIESFEEFWPYYVGEHAKKTTRSFHFVGTTAALGCVAWGILLRKKWLLALAPVAGYGPAWISHFFIEKNKPASFTYPLWSLRADMVMWWKMATRTMDAEVERVLAEEREQTAAAEVPSEPQVSTPGEAVN
jgi:hypothetical protein